jgi:hypothetical protein
MGWRFLITPVVIVTFLVNVVLTPSYALADPPPATPEIVTLKKNDKAPFAGTLFSTSAAAKLLIDLEYNSTVCQVEKDRELGVLRSQLQLKIDLCALRVDTLQLQLTERIQIKDNQIKFLQDQIKPSSWYEHPVFWFAVGFIVATGTTIGITYAVNQD